MLEAVAGLGQLQAPVLVFLAQAYLAADRVADAERAAIRALAFATDGGERGWEAWGRWVLGDALARSGAWQPAHDAFREALVLAEALDMRPLVAHCHARLAVVARAAGQEVDADDHMRAAASLCRELGMTQRPEKGS